MNLAHLLTDTITYQLETGLSGAGAVTWGSQATTPARVEWGTKTVVGLDGTRRESEAAVATDIEIPNGSRVWLPGADTSSVNEAKRPILTKKARVLGGSYILYETYF